MLRETIVTGDTMDILNDLRVQFGNSRTAMQMGVDKYMRLVSPKMAYHSKGAALLPVHWSPGVKSYRNSWWHCMQQDMSRLLITYYYAIREGDNQDWLDAHAMWGRRLRLGIDTFVLVEPTGVNRGWILMSAFDAEELRRAREVAKDNRLKAKLDGIDDRWEDDGGA